MHIWQVKTQIEIAGTQQRPFRLTFVKKDGTIREMIAIKNQKPHNQKTQGETKSNFGYNLAENFLLLLQECDQFRMKAIARNGLGTVHTILDAPADVDTFEYDPTKLKPKTVGLYSIIKFNAQEVHA